MAESNDSGGESTPVETCSVTPTPTERTEDFQKLIDYGLNEKVAIKLDEIYQQGKLKHEVGFWHWPISIHSVIQSFCILLS